MLIDLGHDVCRRLTGAKGRPLGDDASDAWRCTLVHNLLFLSAVLRRELDSEVFSECWWKGLKAPLTAMHAFLVDPANATVAGDYCVELLASSTRRSARSSGSCASSAAWLLAYRSNAPRFPLQCSPWGLGTSLAP